MGHTWRFKGSYKWGYRGSFKGSQGLGSRVVISGVIRPVIWVISIVTPLITLLITTPEPPSKA